MNRAARILVAGASAAVIARACVACGSGGVAAPPPLDAGDSGLQPRDSSTDRGPVGNPFADASPPPPPGLPNGWVLWSGVDKHCGIWVPPSPAYLPPPIQWEACPSTVIPSGTTCQHMHFDWTLDGGTAWALGVTYGTVAADGTALLFFTKQEDAFWLNEVVAADGPVAHAMASDSTLLQPCLAVPSSISPEHYAYNFSMLGKGANIAGDVGTIAPTLVLSGGPALVEDHAVVLQPSTQEYDFFNWSDGTKMAAVFAPLADVNMGLSMAYGTPYKDLITYQATNSSQDKIMLVNGMSDPVDFRAFPDATQGAADLGTDGTDMVWQEGVGRTVVPGPYPTVSIMTAPFTTNPSALAPRRLRTGTSELFAASPFVVGCGYAARAGATTTELLRLSDGQGWSLPRADAWSWSQPLAITCTEMFAGVVEGGGGNFNIARVRLDSLGPGNPAN